MKSRETLIRLKRFQVDEKRQQIAGIESMISDFERMTADLEQQVLSEQERAGISDVTHFAYPTFAKAARQRCDNLQASIDELKGQLERAQDELQAAFEEMKKVELIEEREAGRERDAIAAHEQSQLDEVGLAIHRHR
jgi:flagellar export protein FliJ